MFEHIDLVTDNKLPNLKTVQIWIEDAKSLFPVVKLQTACKCDNDYNNHKYFLSICTIAGGEYNLHGENYNKENARTKITEHLTGTKTLQYIVKIPLICA